jgi:hypothetical protein
MKFNFLIQASDSGYLDIVNALINAHANLDLRDNSGLAALIYSSS